MADWILEQCDWDCLATECDPALEYYASLEDADLVAQSSLARSAKIKGIRNYYTIHHKLSKKQRWCLTFWLVEREMRT